jgi:hypothetical protein
MVVHKALQEFAPTFELEYLLPEWSCRGLPLFPDGKKMHTNIYIYVCGFTLSTCVVGINPPSDICNHDPKKSAQSQSSQYHISSLLVLKHIHY